MLFDRSAESVTCCNVPAVSYLTLGGALVPLWSLDYHEKVTPSRSLPVRAGEAG
jgi:hypothetical protein